MKNKGITLIALVITIIILLILAGVSIAMLTGENGILSQAKKAKEETEEARKNEENIIENYEGYLNSYSGENTEFIDSLGNKVKVPEGFRVINPEDNVEDGIVIEDVVHEKTKGSQFVWIPVGKDIKKSDGTTFDIVLKRYVFNGDGTINEELSKEGVSDQLRKYSENDENYYTEGLKNSKTDNVHAKDIEDFKEKVEKAGGYYIGRYEARIENERKSKDEELGQLTVKADDYIYNYVTQAQAAKASQNMYTVNSNFTSDLVNGFAWDTAVVFLQECDDRENKSILYSKQNSINTTISIKGTNNLTVMDKICNIFDMASNCYEWTTETYSKDGYSTVDRGGGCNSASNFTTGRGQDRTLNTYHYMISFRPIIYL